MRSIVSYMARSECGAFIRLWLPAGVAFPVSTRAATFVYHHKAIELLLTFGSSLLSFRGTLSPRPYNGPTDNMDRRVRNANADGLGDVRCPFVARSSSFFLLLAIIISSHSSITRQQTIARNQFVLFVLFFHSAVVRSSAIMNRTSKLWSCRRCFGCRW